MRSVLIFRCELNESGLTSHPILLQNEGICLPSVHLCGVGVRAHARCWGLNPGPRPCLLPGTEEVPWGLRDEQAFP
jgi:hypothetical protein